MRRPLKKGRQARVGPGSIRALSATGLSTTDERRKLHRLTRPALLCGALFCLDSDRSVARHTESWNHPHSPSIHPPTVDPPRPCLTTTDTRRRLHLRRALYASVRTGCHWSGASLADAAGSNPGREQERSSFTIGGRPFVNSDNRTPTGCGSISPQLVSSLAAISQDIFEFMDITISCEIADRIILINCILKPSVFSDIFYRCDFIGKF